MYGKRNVVKILGYTGLFLVITGVALTSWVFQSLGGGNTSAPSNIIKLKPGEGLYKRGYAYYNDVTDITIATALHPQMSYNFNITKVGGNWTCSKSGIGHDAFSFKPPSRGVYEWTWIINASQDASGELTGSVLESGETYGSGERFLSIGLGLAILGLMLSLFLIVQRY